MSTAHPANAPTRRWSPHALLLSALLLSACTTTPPSVPWPESSLAGEQNSLAPAADPAPDSPDHITPAPTIQRLPSLEGGLRAPRQAPLAQRFSEQRQVQLAADALPPVELIHHVLGEVLQVNYLLADNVAAVTKPITLSLAEAVSERRLFQILQEALARHEIYISGNDELLYLYQQTRQERPELAIGVGRHPSELPAERGQVMQVVPLHYGSPSNFSQLMQRIVDINTVATVSDQQHGALFLFGPRDQVERVMGLIRLIDVPPARGRHVGLRRLTFISPEAFQRELRTLLAAEGIDLGDPGRGDTNLIPLERIGAVAIFAARAEVLERIEHWAAQLDVPRQGAEREYYLYHPEQSSARDLGETIDKLLSLQGGERPVRAGEGEEGQDSALPASKQMVVEERQNALIFHTTASDYQRLLPLIQRLDRMPSQVLLEVTVAEITLDGRLEQGIEWFLRRGDGSLGTRDGLGLGGDGLTGLFTFDRGRLDLLFSLFQQEQRINILSSPRLLVLDGRTATINVGDDVPIITTQSASSETVADRVLQTVQYRSTGINLQVTPQVNARGLVSMQIQQEVSEAGENVLSGVQSPIILQRRINTEVLTADGQSVILGGLIRENTASTKGSVPGLGSIPLLGRLFQVERESNVRTELIVVMTPRILRSADELGQMATLFAGGYRHLLPRGAMAD